MARKKKEPVVIDIFGTIGNALSNIGSFLTTSSLIFVFVAPLVFTIIFIYKMSKNIIYYLKKYMYIAVNNTSSNTYDAISDNINVNMYDNISIARFIVDQTQKAYVICKDDDELKNDEKYSILYDAVSKASSHMRKLKMATAKLSTLDDNDKKANCRKTICNLLTDIQSDEYSHTSNSFIFLPDDKDKLLDIFSYLSLDPEFKDVELADKLSVDEYAAIRNDNIYTDKYDTAIIDIFKNKEYVSQLRDCYIFNSVVGHLGVAKQLGRI